MKNKKLLIDTSLISVILVVSLFAWRQISNLAIRGDGFLYLTKRVQIKYWSNQHILGNFYIGALALSNIFTRTFGTTIRSYFIVELFVMSLINILFFVLIKVLTKSSLIAFLASLILAMNYIGNWDMFGGGIYAYFLERIPNMIFVLSSFLFLHLYLEKKNLRSLYLSLLLFTTAVFWGHWSVLFTAPFLFYPFFYKFFENKNIKNLIRGFLIGISFLAISGFFIYQQNLLYPGLAPHEWTFQEYLFHPQIYNYPYLMLRELIYWSEFPQVMIAKLINVKNSPINSLTVQNAVNMTPIVILVYFLATVLIFFKLEKFRGLLLTLIFATAAIFFLNAYFGEYHILSQPDANRYLYLPTYLLAIFWALLLYTIINLSKNIKLVFLNRVVIGLVLVFYIVVNYLLINEAISKILERHNVTNFLWKYIVLQRKALPANSLVVIPNYELGQYEGEFLTDWLGKGDVKYMSEVEDWRTKIKNVKYAVRISYDPKCNCINQEDLSLGK